MKMFDRVRKMNNFDERVCFCFVACKQEFVGSFLILYLCESRRPRDFGGGGGIEEVVCVFDRPDKKTMRKRRIAYSYC